MLVIGICDGDHQIQTEIGTIIETYLQNQHINGKIFTYDSAEQLTAALKNNKNLHFDILFLDIMMGDMDGMTCAHAIRKDDELVKIFFLTSSTDYVYEGYEVNALGYLLKPVTEHKILEMLAKAIVQIKDVTKETISITSGNVTHRMLISDIMYLESHKNQIDVFLRTPNEKITFYGKLDEFEVCQQSKMWIRPHKSYLVNFLYIEQYTTDKLRLKNGTLIPISRIYKQKVRECFFTLLHNQ